MPSVQKRNGTKRAFLLSMTSALPETIRWVKIGVLRCDHCKTEQKVDGKKKEHLEFFERHARCVYESSSRPASSMTIREAFAMNIMQGFAAHGDLANDPNVKDWVRHAVDVADTLLEVLAQPFDVDDLPELPPEDFELLVEEATEIGILNPFKPT